MLGAVGLWEGSFTFLSLLGDGLDAVIYKFKSVTNEVFYSSRLGLEEV